MNFIGIDIGASFIKGALFDLDNLIIKNINKYPAPTPGNRLTSRFEIDVKNYEKLVMKLILELLRSGLDVSGIVFSTQMHGMVLTDSRLNALTGFIGWQDQRLNEISSGNETWLSKLNKKLAGIDTRETGISLRSGIMGATLFWLKENGYLKQKARAMVLGDYIVAKLTNGESMIDPTNACGSGLFNVRKNQWELNILNALGIKQNLLPKIVKTGTMIGKFKYKNKKIPVFVSSGDMQAAVLGSFVRNKEFCINIGTGSQISVISEKFRKGSFDVRSYFDKKLLLTKTHIPAGRSLNVIIKFIKEIGKDIYGVDKDPWKKLIKVSSKVKNTEGLVVSTSFFKGNAMGVGSGRIVNITESNLTIGNIFYSALSDMTENYFKFFNILGGTNFSNIVLTGGVARSIPLIQKLIRKRFIGKVQLAPIEEETLTGLLILSLYINENFNSIEEASKYSRRKGIKIE